jgi:hypothetical protein
MNNIMGSLIMMFLGSFIIQYFLMSFIMSNDITNITNSIGKFYLSVIMALFMSIFELFMYHMNNPKIGVISYIPFLVFTTIAFIYLYKYQVFVSDQQYLNEMIEHHSMAILTSEQILQKSTNKDVLYLANNIINNQQKEIKEMKKNLRKKKNKNMEQ